MVSICCSDGGIQGCFGTGGNAEVAVHAPDPQNLPSRDEVHGDQINEGEREGGPGTIQQANPNLYTEVGEGLGFAWKSG